jgi:hypothetical protein
VAEQRSKFTSKLSGWGCGLLLALVAGWWLFATVRRFFAQPNPWQQLGWIVAGIALSCIGFPLLMLGLGALASLTQRPRPSLSGECRALCRALPMRRVPDAAWSPALEEMNDVTPASQRVTVRFDGAGLYVSASEPGPTSLHIPFDGFSLYHVFERAGQTLTATIQPGYTGPLPTCLPCPEIAIAVVYTSLYLGPPPERPPVTVEPSIMLHLVALGASGLPDQMSTRGFYSLLHQALVEYWQEVEDANWQGSRPMWP